MLGATGKAFSALTLRAQLLLAINLPLLALVSIFLAYDFRRELAERIREKRVALAEEAQAMLPAIAQMQRQGVDDVQDYIDAVCARMQNADSPGHHIAVAIGDTVLQADFHQRASQQYLDAVRLAAESPRSGTQGGNDSVIAGSATNDGITVYVSEQMSQLRRSVWNDLVRRIAGFLILAGIAGGLVNVLLLRLVTTPLERLVSSVRQIADGNLGVQTPAATSAELSFLSDEINAMSKSLADADKYRGLQMAKAREIQQQVLPAEQKYAGVDLSSLFQPADEVGGDYFDIIELPDGKLLVCVADVSGHGVSAAMLTMLLRALLHTAAELHETPHQILEFMNRRFVDATLPEDFATVFLLEIDVDSERLTYASAGHEPGLLLTKDGELSELGSTAIILGIDEDAEFESEPCDFSPGDRLLLYTDGVTETHGADGQLFGHKKLIELLERSSSLAAPKATEQLNAALVDFRDGAASNDDVAFVLIEMSGGGLTRSTLKCGRAAK